QPSDHSPLSLSFRRTIALATAIFAGIQLIIRASPSSKVFVSSHCLNRSFMTSPSAPPAGIEPATFRLTTGRSVRLSYGDDDDDSSFILLTSSLSSEEGGGFEPPGHLFDVRRVSSAVHSASLPTLRRSRFKRRVRDSNSQWPCDHRR